MRARRMTDATRESSKLETLGNLLVTRPDMVASIISRVGILKLSLSSVDWRSSSSDEELSARYS